MPVLIMSQIAPLILSGSTDYLIIAVILNISNHNIDKMWIAVYVMIYTN